MQVDVDATIRSLEQTERAVIAAAGHALEAGVEASTRAAKGTVLWRDKSGETRGSVRGEAQATRGFVRAGGAAKFLENGTRAHEIHGRPFLRFVVNGQVLFRRMVNHPGTRPRPFMFEARNIGETAAHFAAERLVNLALR